MAKRKSRRERRTFNAEYKQQVLELVRAGDKSVTQICRDLDLTESSVRKWIKTDQTLAFILRRSVHPALGLNPRVRQQSVVSIIAVLTAVCPC